MDDDDAKKALAVFTAARGLADAWLARLADVRRAGPEADFVGAVLAERARKVEAAAVRTTELTQAQWTALMGNNPSHFKGETLPVESVSWEDAMAFCKKLTERERTAGRLPAGWEFTLPTEAQWEYACRAGTTGDYAGDLDAMAWYSSNSERKTHPVDQKKANAWGLSDMHGNVWEWCLDWYGSYSDGSATDPTGAASGSFRVFRGGSWDSRGGELPLRESQLRFARPSLQIPRLPPRPQFSPVVAVS